MIKRFTVQRLSLLMATAGMIGFTNCAMASGFQLWEQDGASIGNYHAGIAANAEDASTAFYNPAGLVRLHNQQLVVGVDPILTDVRFNGTVNVTNPLATSGPIGTNAQGGTFNLVPDMHYAAPITDRIVFGLSVVAPFGLQTNYGMQDATRYAATLTSLRVVDLSPSLGIALTDKFSVGAGFDAEHARGEFDLVGGLPIPFFSGPDSLDTPSVNVGTSNAYGYHLGALYQFNDNTRVGLAYHSQIVHHLRGSSKFGYGALANFPNSTTNGFQGTDQLSTNITLPPTTSLSVFHTFNPSWDGMASISYTQWNVFSSVVLQNAAGVISDGEGGLIASNNIAVTIPENYRNTWNYSIGANYHASEQWFFRTGLGYDQTPTNDTDRNLQLPDSDRIAVALGTHYQTTKTIGLDFGWTHFFAMNGRRINNNTETVGAQQATVNGNVKGGADVFGLQATWDIL